MALVDTAVAGHLGDSVYIAGIALGGAVFNIIYWLLNFLRTGTSGLVGQAVGREDRSSGLCLLCRMGIFALVLGLVIIVFGEAICEGVMLFMDADTKAQTAAQSYVFAAIWGVPAYLATYVLSGWFVGEQDTRPILAMAISSNLLNAVLSPILALGVGLKIEGIAFATAISQWVGFIVGLFIFVGFIRRRNIRLKQVLLTNCSKDVRLVKLLRINCDIFLRTLCLVAVTMWFTRAGAQISNTVLAANAVLMQLFMLFSFFSDGFAFAGEALAARDYGAGDYVSLKSTVRSLLMWGAAMALMCSVLYFLCGDSIVALLTDSQSVRLAASQTMYWIVAIPICGFMAFTWDGVFIGMTMTGRMLISMAVAMVVFFMFYYVFSSTLGVHALWLAFILYLVVRGLVQQLMFAAYMRRVDDKSK